jgi:hypothetical protein
MKLLMPALCVVFLAAGAAVSDEKEKKDKEPAEGMLVKASAAEVAKDFEKDREAARKKYTPQPAPEGKKGGTAVEVTGVVSRVEVDGSLVLDSGGGWLVYAQGPIKGEGPNATVGVKGVAVGDKIVVLKGSIECKK